MRIGSGAGKQNPSNHEPRRRTISANPRKSSGYCQPQPQPPDGSAGFTRLRSFPCAWWRRVDGGRSLRCLGLATLFGLAAAMPRTTAQTFSNFPAERFGITDGPVNCLADGGDVVYLGGSFTYAGPYTGCAVALDTTTGAAAPNFPRVEGVVSRLVADGAGGWFLGGGFTRVGGLARRSLAHVRADRTVDADWVVDLEITGSLEISALAYYGGTLYFAGDFVKVAGQWRANLAAVDAATGALRSWDPAPSGQYQGIRALTPHNGLIYVGGDFTAIGGESHAGLAALDPISAKPAPWNPSVYGTVMTIAPVGTTVYFGGFFSQVGSEARSLIAAVDSVTGLPLAWNPVGSGNAFAMVDAIVPDGDTIYVGGYFTGMGGQARTGLAAVDRVTGQATAWDPRCDGLCPGLALGPGVIYVGGAFNRIGGKARWHIAALDLVTANALDWDPEAGGHVVALALEGSQLIAGGDAASYGGRPRQGLAAVDKQTGHVTDWNPDLTGNGILQSTALALAIVDNRVLAGTKDYLANGLPSGHLLAIDRADGQVSVLAQANSDVRAVVVRQGLAYIGGSFNSVGGNFRRRLAAVDLATGLLTDWTTELRSAVSGGTSWVNALALQTNTLFAGGSFGLVSGLPRNSVAAIDLATGIATDWVGNLPSAPVGDGVKTLCLTDSTLWVGGVFGPFSSGGLYALDSGTGQLKGFNAGAVLGWFGSVKAAMAVGPTVYAAGASGSPPSSQDPALYRLAGFDSQSGALGSWNPSANSSGNALLTDGQYLYLGGDFNFIAGEARFGFAAFGLAPPGRPQILPGSVRFLSPGAFQFSIDLAAGQSFTVQTSEDLRQWKDLPLQTATSDPMPFSDAGVTGKMRFYRIVAP